MLLKDMKILVAEDNPLNQKVAGFILQKNGAIVSQALNGEEALTLVADNDYDAILMDLHMPGTDGFGATEYIRRTLKNDVPIIAITASNFEQEERECIEIGMDDCIHKPFDPVILCETILRVIKQKQTNS